MMSWPAVLAAFRWSRARPTARLVLLALAARADPESGEAWPSVATLAQETGLGRRAVQTALRDLEDAGEIERRPGSGHGGRGRSARYTLKSLLAKGAPAAPIGDGERAHLTPKRAHLTTPKGARDAPEVVRKGKKDPRAGDAAYGASRRTCIRCGTDAELEAGRCPECYAAWERGCFGEEGAA